MLHGYTYNSIGLILNVIEFDEDAVKPTTKTITWEVGSDETLTNGFQYSSLWFYRPFKDAVSKRDVLYLTSTIDFTITGVELRHSGYYICYGSYAADGSHHFIATREILTIIRGMQIINWFVC